MDVMPMGSMVYQGALGTIAEIYEFQEESEGQPNGAAAGMSSFALKAKGRQRFNVVSFRRQADGNLMGTVKIRPEIRLSPLVQGIIFNQTHRYRFPVKRSAGEPQAEEDEGSPRSPVNRWKRRHRNSSSTADDKAMETDDSRLIPDEDSDLMAMRRNIHERRKVTKYYSAFTPFPYFVYDQFDEHILVEQVHRKLTIELKGVTDSGGIIPNDANELSFWLAQHLAMDDHHRIKILKMDTPVQRLRYELNLLAKAVS
jgi:hypothetical protein